MSRFEIARAALAAHRAKGLLVAMAAAVAISGLATPAGAASIFLDKAEMFNPGTAYITGPNGSNYPQAYVYAGPVQFTANWGAVASSNTFQFLGFCVDIYDDINVGVNSPLAINLAYQEGPLVDNGAHSPYPVADKVVFTQQQKDNISALVNYGTQIWNNDALTDPSHNLSNTVINQLAGVQGAIWQIENPTFSVTGAPPVNGWGDTATITSNINLYSSQPFLSTLQVGKIDVIFSSDDPKHQTFAFAAVPEPSTWLTMILGFGAAGVVLRRNRQIATVAV